MKDRSSIKEMWNTGMDTKDIAFALWIKESQVYNALAFSKQVKTYTTKDKNDGRE